MSRRPIATGCKEPARRFEPKLTRRKVLWLTCRVYTGPPGIDKAGKTATGQGREPMQKQITIRPAGGTWVIRAGGAVIGESSGALELDEVGHAPVIYFPREDVAMAFLDRSDHRTHCPLKGDASYFDIMSKSRSYGNAVWSYVDPREEVAEIREYLAFHQQEGVTVEQV